ncbi:Rqc2 family fibronectin-binding protein [Desulfotomaculum nigrificans]|uniref:Rqc2 family fibronectin-binding protein n=1 Tax=Desulfotomaculum nigrificans TaxID=1565 RepID=UPI0001FADF9B|nr:NFACT RNA binding domain-containing protein [Desulfotomaculum nigrificans]
MAFDGLVMAAVAGELAEKLIGGRVERIQQPGPSELVLVIHTRERGKQRLYISADARDARIHITSQSYVNPIAPPIFCMVLRKHLEGGRIRAVQQSGLERVIHLSIDSRDELGRPGEKLLICEIMGKHSNILLVNPDNNNIVDGIHRYSHSVSRYREVLPNRPYLPPPEQNKLDPRQISEEQFRQIMLDSNLESTVADVLLQKIAGIGPQTCRELVVRAGLPPDYLVNHCGDYELTKLWEQVKTIAAMLDNGTFAPTLLLDRRGRPIEFAALDLTHVRAYRREHGEISIILDRYYQSLQQKRLIESQRQSLSQITRKEIARLKKKVDLYRKSLATAEKADKYRIYGELLTANLYHLEQGPEARVQNFYHPEAEEIVIPMDQSLTPSENAQAYFKKYLKAKNTREAVTAHLAQAEAELAYLEAVDNAVSQATDLADLDEIRSELEEQTYLKPKTQQGAKRSKKDQDRPQPLTFVSSDGIPILVGKNNKQNDYLTLRLAQDGDMWLHTKDIPGSHVIIRCHQLGAVPDQTLLEAATLAAWFSKARQAGKVPVDYTYRRHVRKPKGAKPGMVIYDNQRTITVVPSEEIVDKITPEDETKNI